MPYTHRSSSSSSYCMLLLFSTLHVISSHSKYRNTKPELLTTALWVNWRGYQQSFIALKHPVPQQEKFTCLNDFQLQAFLNMKRIITQANLTQPYRLYLKSLLEIAESVINRCYSANQAKFLCSVLNLIFEELNGFEPIELDSQSVEVFTKTLELFENFGRID